MSEDSEQPVILQESLTHPKMPEDTPFEAFLKQYKEDQKAQKEAMEEIRIYMKKKDREAEEFRTFMKQKDREAEEFRTFMKKKDREAEELQTFLKRKNEEAEAVIKRKEEIKNLWTSGNYTLWLFQSIIHHKGGRYDDDCYSHRHFKKE